MLGTSLSHQNYGIDFNLGVADTFSLFRFMNMRFADASICDTIGQLLFYTNGIYIENGNHDSLKNSDNFNPGTATVTWNSVGLQIQQACLILPFPGSDSLYYIFHESAEQLPIWDAPFNLSYSIVDMTLDGGLGGIINSKKNIHIIEDTLIWGRVAACKHADGRDYWVLTHNYYTDVFYKLLVTPDTIIVNVQTIGLSHDVLPNYYGQAIFSPDGNKYAIEINDTTIELYNFDRCNGVLSNPITISIADTDSQGTVFALLGTAFSASSQYLYINNDGNIHQYDTWGANVLASGQVVAQWDTFYAPCCNAATTFFMLQLAQDNRIYISQSAGTDILHYIEFPDSAGLACHVVQDSFITPGYNTFTFPNIVNYDLMNDITSPCDTVLSVNDHTSSINYNFISIFPNPATEYFWVNYSIPLNEKAFLDIYDALGNRVMQSVLYGSSKSLLVHSEMLNDGIYFYKVVLKNNTYANGRIVLLK